MDGPTRLHRNNTNRFLGAYPRAFPVSDTDLELTEDDIIFTPDLSPPATNNHSQTPPSPLSSSSPSSSATHTPRNKTTSIQGFSPSSPSSRRLTRISTTKPHPLPPTGRLLPLG